MIFSVKILLQRIFLKKLYDKLILLICFSKDTSMHQVLQL